MKTPFSPNIVVIGTPPGPSPLSKVPSYKQAYQDSWMPITPENETICPACKVDGPSNTHCIHRVGITAERFFKKLHALCLEHKMSIARAEFLFSDIGFSALHDADRLKVFKRASFADLGKEDMDISWGL